MQRHGTALRKTSQHNPRCRNTTRQFLVDRYGDFVLLKPPLNTATLALWFGPACVFVLGGIGVLLYLRRRPTAAPPLPPLTDAERLLA